MGYRTRNVDGIARAVVHLEAAKLALLDAKPDANLNGVIAHLVRAKYEVDVSITSLIEESSS